jgi:hypothetical protein
MYSHLMSQGANKEVQALTKYRNANLDAVSSQTARLAELSTDMDHYTAQKISLVEAREVTNEFCIALISNFDFTQATRLQVIHHSNSNQSRFCFFLKKGLNFIAWIKFLTYVCKQRMQ